MTNQIVTVIVPRLPPSIDGLGDYAFALARQMRSDLGLNVEFIVGDPNWKGHTDLDGFPVKKVEERSAAALLRILPKDRTVFLNYVGYGYARRGSPVWLVKALETWKKQNDTRLVTMFHELYAFGPIWTSQFWTSPLQRNLCARLVRLSENAITSKTQYAEKIVRFSKGKHPQVEMLPIFSNVGEPEKLTNLENRSRRLVVFGGKGPRARVYNDAFESLERICRDLMIEEVIDLGPALDFEIRPVNGMKVNCLGPKPANEVSQILADCMVGFLNYPTGYLAKSGIFAAYCAHRMVPVGISWEGQDIDHVTGGKEYLEMDKVKNKISIQQAQIIADHAHSWYQRHSLPIQAKFFFERLTGTKV